MRNRSLHPVPHPGHSDRAVGSAFSPDVQDDLLELSTGSVVPGPGVVVGLGLGVTVITVGGRTTLPIIVVLFL